MFTPALKLLKDNIPDSQIDAMVMFKGVKDIYSRLPEINSVHHFDFLNRSPFDALKFVLSLRKKYSVTVNVYPSNRKEYNVINFLIGAKERATVKYKRMDFQNLGFLNNVRIIENDSTHNVIHNLGLIRKAFDINSEDKHALNFPLLKEDFDFADNFFSERNISTDELLIGFHPGCAVLKNHTKRRWETEKFAALTDKLFTECGAKIFLFGGPEEAELRKEILSLAATKNIVEVSAGSLAESAAVMQRMNVFVSNDSSLMHISAALQLKTVAIIGPTNEEFIHPWNTNYKIASLNLECAPCFFYSPKPLTCKRTDIQFKCIRELDVELVFSKVKEFID